MSVIASRDLRNHTRDVLRQVADGTVVTITVNGEPVAELSRPASPAARTHLTRAEVDRLLDRRQVDPTLELDMAWISAGSTDELDPLR